MIKVTSEVKTITQMTRDLPGPLALIPTMGALHEGHLGPNSSRPPIRLGPTGTVAISIFVNPIQFDRTSDLANYPRPLKSDLGPLRERRSRSRLHTGKRVSLPLRPLSHCKRISP
jgi:pantoate--beta-alanine ligase